MLCSSSSRFSSGVPVRHDRVLRLQVFDRLRGAGLPVFDPLGLVENDQIGRPTGDQSAVEMKRFVVGDLEKRIRFVGGAAGGAEPSITIAFRLVKVSISFFHWCLSEVGVTISTRSTPMRGQRISVAANDWMVLPKAHVIGKQRSAGPRGKQSPCLWYG